MKSLSDRAGLLIVLYAFKFSVGFIVPMLLVRLLTKNDYGTYQQLVLIATTAVGMMRLGIPASIYYFFNTVAFEQRNSFVRQTLALMMLSGIVTTAGLYFLAPLLAQKMSNPQIAELLPVYCLYVLFFLASDHIIDFLINKDRYHFSLAFQVTESIVRVLLLVLPLLFGFGLYGLVISVVAFAVLRYLAALIVLREHFGTGTGGWVDTGLVKSQLAYSLPLALSSLVGLVGRVLDKALVALFFTPAQYAVYAVGALEIPLDSVFQASVANVLRSKLPPLVKAGSYAEVAKILQTSVRKLALIILPIFCFLLVFSHDFITLLFTDSYAESVRVFDIYLLLAPLNIFILSLIPQVFGYTRVNMYITITTVVFNIAASFLLLKTVGYLGPAIAAVSTAYLATIIYLVVATRLLRQSVFSIVPVAAVAKISAVCLGAAIAAYFSTSGIPFKAIRLFSSGVVFCAVYGIAIYALGLLTQGDREVIQRGLAKVPLLGRMVK